MNSSAIPTINNCAIPTLTPFAAFFPVHANEKHEQAKTAAMLMTLTNNAGEVVLRAALERTGPGSERIEDFAHHLAIVASRARQHVEGMVSAIHEMQR